MAPLAYNRDLTPTARNLTMATTRTGNISIGFRRGWGQWQRDAPALCAWAAENGFECIDVSGDAAAVEAVQAAGMAVGSVDLAKFGQIITADADQRVEIVAANTKLIRECVDLGQRIFFTCLLPADPALPRKENFEHMLAGYEPLIQLCDELNAHIVIEGYPGPGALGCSPETLDVLFERFDTPAVGVNYDPSHLIRLGIDPLVFLGEYITKIFHIHAKDTELLTDRQYLLGTEQPPTFAPAIRLAGRTGATPSPATGACDGPPRSTCSRTSATTGASAWNSKTQTSTAAKQARNAASC
jgi:sugar phosphate isomerase/epimerase